VSPQLIIEKANGGEQGKAKKDCCHPSIHSFIRHTKTAAAAASTSINFVPFDVCAFLCLDSCLLLLLLLLQQLVYFFHVVFMIVI